MSEASILSFVQPPSSFQGYEKPEHSRTAPIGIPFGYVLEVTSHLCGACGKRDETSRLIAVERAGYGHMMLPLNASTPVFDRAIRRVNRASTTPVCLQCIEDTVPTPVPYPVPGRIVNTYRGDSPNASRYDAGGRVITRRIPAPVRPADVADDFI
jgi:hypothetical protein